MVAPASTHSIEDEDARWMKLALEQAQLAYDRGEVPVGALLVRGSEVLCMAGNEVERSQDASKHAELSCLRLGARALGQWRLHACTLYCTLEPCVMCYGAMILFRLKRLVWAAPDLRHGALGSVYDLSQKPHPIHALECRGPFMPEQAGDLMRRFFQEKRASKRKSLPQCPLETGE